jgi:predicted glycoside hydrolase/deacetylase ChbG (UPF0249 family)
MAARLILNADDFGLTRGINRAIAELHAAGALLSTTLMANGPAFEDAAAIARANPQLGVGCHIVLTDGVPVSLPETVPSLLGADRKTFRPSLTSFLFDVLRGEVSEAEIFAESCLQIRQLQHAGIAVTHIDTHKHTHILRRVARPLLAAAKACGVPAIRNPFEQTWSLKLGRSSPLRRLQVLLAQPLRHRFAQLLTVQPFPVRTPEGTLGISATGHLDEGVLRSVLAAMPDGTFELVCHPGYNDADLDATTTRLRSSRAVELAALLSVFGAGETSAHPRGWELINYKALTSLEDAPGLA